MGQLTKDELFEKYPYLEKFSQYIIFSSKEDVDEILNSEKIEIMHEKVSLLFLKRILNNKEYYEYARRYFNNEIDSFCVTNVINGDFGRRISYSKSTIIKGIEKLISEKKLILNNQEKERYDDLKNLISLNSFIEKYKDTSFNIEIDNNYYSIPFEQIIEIMQLKEEDFEKICLDEKIENVYDIPKEHFLYAVKEFFTQKEIFKNYIMPNSIKNRYEDIFSSKNIDIEAINKLLVTEDKKYKDLKVDENLKKAIIDGIPQEASELEKAIYIYIKMCKILTYDDEYYAVNQKGPATLKHKNVEYASYITPVNNKVVCFEFNLIYANLLDKLGIKFESDYKNLVGEAYGEGHANLSFRTGKFLVDADSVTSILYGDLIGAKLNKPLVGLKCKNTNSNTQHEFNEAVSKMYKVINDEEKKLNNLKTENFDELINEYSKLCENIEEIDLNSRLNILIEKVNSTNMEGIDSLAYILQLRKIMFSEDEQKNNIGFVIIRNNEVIDTNRVAMASAIFTVNEQSFENNALNRYYYFSPNNKLVDISKEELQEKFNNNFFEYINDTKIKIPGIVEVGSVENVR